MTRPANFEFYRTNCFAIKKHPAGDLTIQKWVEVEHTNSTLQGPQTKTTGRYQWVPLAELTELVGVIYDEDGTLSTQDSNG